MKALILPLVLVLLGLGGGLTAGQFLRPPPPPPEETAEAPAEGGEAAAAAPAPAEAHAAPAEPAAPTTEFVKLERQFVVPVIQGEKVGSLMVISMAIEVDIGASTTVFDREPKLRDEFLRVLFTHAQSGGFSGDFTDPAAMEDLRAALGATAQTVLGSMAKSVLLTNLVRQDLS